MRTIAEPKERISKLWGKQRANEDDTYRMMRYVMRVDLDNKVRLHNVVTGQLVELAKDEAEILDTLPRKYCKPMDQLIDGHYLVPDQYDEHRMVVNMRTILRKLAATQQQKGIHHYTILPTTSCNARCYYCFERGTKTFTMTKAIADDVIDFIDAHCEDKRKVTIMWFGGEPTVAANRIDQISSGLKERGIEYVSTMVSNAYLFDEEMVRKAKDLWNLKRIQISVDGMEERYNEVKSFINAKDNPFQRVMRNIELLLENGIRVGLRMNYDISNHMEFPELLKYASERFGNNKNLQVYAYPVIGDYPEKDGIIRHGSDEWRKDKTVRLNDYARESGMYSDRNELPCLHHIGCSADDDDSLTINAQGFLVKCPEHYEEADSIGNLKDGILNKELVQAWKEIADYDICKECTFFPRCVRQIKCSAGDRCYFQDRNKQFYDKVRGYSTYGGI